MGLIQEYNARLVKMAEATKVLLEVEESNLDMSDPNSIFYRGKEDENENPEN